MADFFNDQYEWRAVRIKKPDRICKHCGKRGLEWMSTPNGWRLFDKGEQHECKHASKTSNNDTGERLATAQRAGDAISGHAKMLLSVVSPYVRDEDRGRIDRLRRAVERWESLRSVEFVAKDETMP